MFLRNSIFRTLIVWSIGVPAAFVLFPFALLGALIDRSGDAVHSVGSLWVGLVLKLAGVGVEVRGAGNIPEGPVVFAANHIGTFDIPVVQANLPKQFRWVAKKSLFSIPIVGWAMTLGGYVPIDMENARAAVRSIKAASEKIRSGTSVLIFPEGTRNRTGEMLPFKRGGFMLALKSGAPVVPVSIAGTRDIMNIGGFVIHPNNATVVIGRPIPTEGLDEQAVMKLVREAIEEGIEEAERINVGS